MGDGIFGYPESKHGGKIKKRPFADAKNLPYNPPHLIVQAFSPSASIPPTSIPHTLGTFSTAPATYHSFTTSIRTISTAIPHTIPYTIPLAIPHTIPHAIPSTISATILSSIPNSLRISPNLVLNNPLILISRLIFRILGVFCVFSAF